MNSPTTIVMTDQTRIPGKGAGDGFVATPGRRPTLRYVAPSAVRAHAIQDVARGRGLAVRLLWV